MKELNIFCLYKKLIKNIIYLLLLICVSLNQLYAQECNADTIVADYTFSQDCNTNNIHFTNASSVYSGSISSYYWNFGDGDTSQNPDHTYASTGNYTVTLTLLHSSGCFSVKTSTVVVLATPIAQFVASADSVCPSQIIGFANSSVGAGLSYQWYFRDGANYNNVSDTILNPSHNFYTAIGTAFQTFNIMLKVTDQNNCIDTIIHPIVIKQSPLADFVEIGNFRRCENVIATVSDTANIYNYSNLSQISSYQIDWGNGSGFVAVTNPFTSITPITHVYNTVNNFPITIKAMGYNGCYTTFKDTFEIITIPLPEFSSLSFSSGCVPFEVFTINNSLSITPNTITYINWGDNITDTLPIGALPGDTLRHYYTKTTCINGLQQPYNIKLTTKNECGSPFKSYGPINVFAPPKAGIDIVDDSVCVGNPVTFLNQTIPNYCAANPRTLYTWDFGDTSTSIVMATLQNPIPNQDHIYNLPGTFDVVLKAENNSLPSTGLPGCGSSNDTLKVFVFETNAVFFFDTVCFGNATHFTDSSSAPGGTIVSRTWDFGDGASSTMQNPQHTYLLPGQYIVTLSASGSLGCTDVVTHTIIIDSLPEVNFLHSNTCLGDTTFFTNISKANSDSLVSYNWSFGDSSAISTTKNSFHVYHSSGIYNVTLTVFNSKNCQKDTTIKVFVYPKPIASFYTDTVCSGYQRIFTNNSIPVGGNINSFHWNMGDGIGSCIQSDTIYNYAGTGTYPVNLSITDINGCKDDTIINIYLGPVPIAAFTLDTVCYKTPTHFINTTNSQGIPFTSVWEFSDGFTATTTNANHTFNIYSAYNVKLKVTNINGCIDSTVHTIILNTLPSPLFTSTVVCKGDTTKFTDFSTASGASITIRNWSFGDGNNSLQVNPNHVYPNSGNYNAKLIVTDSKGCKKDTIIPISVLSLPTPSIIVNKPCKGQLSGFSTLSANPAYTNWKWNFGINNDSSYLSNPYYTYFQTGNYNVHLTVKDINGCKNDTLQTIFISPIPKANFISDTVCFGNNSHFTDMSIDSGYSINSWQWNFGDVSMSNNTNPIHLYNNAGIYTAKLLISNIYGCLDSVSKNVIIDTIPYPNFVANAVCLGNNTIFSDISTTTGASITSWQWNFGDGDTSNAQHPQHLYHNSGVFNVTLNAIKSNGCNNDTTINIRVYQLPKPDFTLNSYCVNTQISFTSQNTLTPTMKWHWGFGDGGIDSIQQPSHIFLTSGNYSVQLHVVDSNQCKGDTIKHIFISPFPIANFSFDTNCFGEATHFVNLTIDSSYLISNWNWNFGDAAVSSLINPSHVFNNYGYFNVQLQVKNIYGCVDSIIKIIKVDTLPIADFAVNNVQIGNTTSFTDMSIANSLNIIDWKWDFGDTLTSTLQNPQHLYNLPETYGVRLIVKNSNGCKDTIIKDVFVFPLPTPDFLVAPVCLGDTSHFIDNSLSLVGDIIDWQWKFGDGYTSNIQNPIHQYVSAGNYTAWLTVTNDNGIKDSISHIVTVYQNPIAIFYSDTVCYGDTTHFYNHSTSSGSNIISWNWNFDDGSTIENSENPSHKFANVITSVYYHVSLIISDNHGCSDTSVNQLKIFSPVVADFISDTVCNNSSVHLSDISNSEAGSIVAWNWNFGNGISNSQQYPIYSYSNITNDTSLIVRLIVKDILGCKDTVYHPLLIHPQPVVLFKSDTSCLGLLTHFTDLSYSNGGILTMWNWNFGGSASSTMQNPQRLFLNAGIFNTTLSVTDINGCSNSATFPILVDSIPEVNFLFHGNCASGLINFTDHSISHGSSNVTWNWNFGDSYSSSIQNPIHYYTVIDTFYASLTVSNINGCKSTLSKEIYINPSMSYDFHFDTVCLGLSTHFYDNFLIQNTQISSRLWDFGDGNSSALHNTQHTYSNAGIYNVSLTVFDTNGCSETIHHNIIVNTKPLPDFLSTFVCKGDSTRFTNNTYSASGIISYFWNFGDGYTSSLPNPSHLYPSSGNYHVKLIVVNANGCSDSIIKTVSVNSIPLANFNVGNICSAYPVIISDSSLNSVSSINSWLWEFGDGDSLFVSNPAFYLPTISHAYANSGVFTIHLTVKNYVCSDTISKTIEVYPIPVAKFHITNNCLGDTSRFIDSSFSNGNAIVNRIWSFGDGTSSTLQNPTHLYLNPGVYNVTLTITDIHGCVNTKTNTIVIFNLPIANFSASVVPYPNATHFTNISVGSPAAINSWNWIFGDGIGYSNLENPVYSFLSINTYNSRLIVSDTNGCKDTVEIPVVVCSPFIHANFTFSSACEKSFTYFTDSSIINTGNGILSWNWKFDDGSTSILQNPQHQYVNSGTYNVRLIVTGIFGISDTINKIVTVYPKPIADFDNNNVCIGVAKTFVDLSTVLSGNIVQWYWDFGNGNVANTLNQSTIYNTLGNYTVRYIVTTDMGCSDSVNKIVKISPLPVINFTSDIIEGCIPVYVNFTNISTVDSGYISIQNWDFDDGNTSIANTSIVGHTFLNAGSYNVSLNATSNNGCNNTLTIPNMIVVHPNPEAIFTLTPSKTTILNSSISFYDNSLETSNWKWYFGDGDSSIIQAPIHTYIKEGTYYPKLKVTSDYGCSDESTEEVVILRESTFYVPNAFTPNNDGYNDVFMPVSVDFNKRKFEMMIFNRLGQMIFYSEDYNNGWNGTWNGDDCPDGVYVWKINYTDALGLSQKETGCVTLVR
ncbi:MAG: PKD domain-containing protein [Bacteroidetes bacterium]|nr:PKD domain-containing protein [Bacteroidota bacterium]